MTNTPQYPAGTYVKGDDARLARTPAAAVALVFSGYSLARTESKTDPEKVLAPLASDSNLDGPTRPELVALAKELGIPANQSTEALREAVESATNPSNES